MNATEHYRAAVQQLDHWASGDPDDTGRAGSLGIEQCLGAIAHALLCIAAVGLASQITAHAPLKAAE